MIVGKYNIHINEIYIKNQVCHYYFNNAANAKKLATNNILIDEKSYKYLVIYFTKFAHNKLLKNLRLC